MSAAGPGGAPDGRRWSAVLVLSALVLGVAGWQLVADRGAGTEAPPVATLAVAADPGPTAPTRAAAPAHSWPTRPATVPPAQPVAVPERLRVPAAGLDLPIDPTGVDDRGRMALPDRPTRVGWYAFGAAPGDRAGTAVLAGHVDSDRYGIGPLAALAGLHRGDEVVVSGSGRTTRYQVLAVQRIAKTALPTDRLFVRTGSPLLRLVTCGGAYDPVHGYADNVVVTARPR